MSKFIPEKAPPNFDRKTGDYPNWKTRFKFWQNHTDISKTKQGGFLLFSLDDKTQDSLLDLLTAEDINKENGAETVFKCLDWMFQKNKFTRFKTFQEYLRSNCGNRDEDELHMEEEGDLHFEDELLIGDIQHKKKWNPLSSESNGELYCKIEKDHGPGQYVSIVKDPDVNINFEVKSDRCKCVLDYHSINCEDQQNNKENTYEKSCEKAIPLYTKNSSSEIERKENSSKMERKDVVFRGHIQQSGLMICTFQNDSYYKKFEICCSGSVMLKHCSVCSLKIRNWKKRKKKKRKHDEIVKMCSILFQTYSVEWGFIMV